MLGPQGRQKGRQRDGARSNQEQHKRAKRRRGGRGRCSPACPSTLPPSRTSLRERRYKREDRERREGKSERGEEAEAESKGAAPARGSTAADALRLPSPSLLRILSGEAAIEGTERGAKQARERRRERRRGGVSPSRKKHLQRKMLPVRPRRRKRFSHSDRFPSARESSPSGKQPSKQADFQIGSPA